MSAIDILTRRVEEATKARSKEIRMSLNDAQGVVFELARLLSRENDLLQKITDLQENGFDKSPKSAKIPSSRPISGEVVMDGGGFKDR
jgi:hypothetical protein